MVLCIHHGYLASCTYRLCVAHPLTLGAGISSIILTNTGLPLGLDYKANV